MTGIQLAPPTAVAPKPATWTEPAQQPALGKHGSVVRARLSLRRMFYAARHAAR
ncbi:MAG TPA: hypothetical protein VHO01_13620 [Jatrophihabitans sp.]|nr:hypothetical protein [Jatrophihabitans sp.]